MRRQGKRDGDVNSPLQNGRRAALKDRVYTAGEERWRGELAVKERDKSGPKGPRVQSGGGDGRDRLDHAPTREERWRGELAATERKKSGPKGPRLHRREEERP